MRICMLCTFVLVSLTIPIASSSNVFRFGAVLSTTGERSDYIEAKNGYQLFIETVNRQSRGSGFFLRGRPGTKGFHFKYEFLWRDDNSDSQKHVEEIEDLVYNKRIHFLGGSSSAFAEDEMKIANDSRILNVQCCVGPDAFYERDYKTVFGISSSNRGYTRMTIQRLSLENVQKLRIVAEESDPFTRTTCEAAVDFSREFNGVSESSNQIKYVRYRYGKRDSNFFDEFANQCKEDKIEAVIACVEREDSTLLVNAFHDIKYPLKVFFITVSPTKQEWIDGFSPAFRADNLLSAAQWHKDMKYSDDFFGTGLEYAERYQDMFNGTEPTYVSAGASAASLTLHRAIVKAFRKCDIKATNGVVDQLLYNASAIACDDDLQMNGYDRILTSLEGTDLELFFGTVRFNRFRRNIGHVPVTTQVLLEKQQDPKEERREIRAVLPLGLATSLLRLPAKNYYPEDCPPGYFVGSDPYDRCVLCPRGSVSFKNNSDHCDSCPLDEYNDDIGQSGCKPCPLGSTTPDRGSISVRNCSCLEGYYHPLKTNGLECIPCPDNAVCNGSLAQPYPKRGYWMNETYHYNSYSCDPSDVCIGGENFACKKGTKGRKCGECDDDYFSIVDACYKCPQGSLIVFFCVMLLIVWYVINVIVSRSVASLEMLLGWAQLANIIGDIDLNWTTMLTDMFGVANVLDFDVDILEPSCLIKNWGFKQNFIVQLCLPFLMSLMAATGYLTSSAVFYASKRSCCNLKGKSRTIVSWIISVPDSKADLGKKWDVTIAAFLASIDITYVTIAKYCFDVFKCENVAGVSVLRSSPSIECGTTEHKLLISLSSLGIAFYVLGYLVYATWTLFALQKKKAFSNEQNIQRFGFIYQKFELDYYYTPIIIILRKLVFVIVLVYLNDPAFQLGALAIVINASLMIHIFTAPYVDTYIDILFSFLLLALMFEAFGGLMFYSDNLPENNRIILEWIVMSALFLLILVFVVIFVMEISIKFHIHQVKMIQIAHALMKTRSFPRALSKSSSSTKRKLLEKATDFARLVSRRDDLGLSFELLDTFDPSFVHRCMKKDPSLIKDWEKLTNMLETYVSDQAPTSYLSVESTAKFWRKLVDRLPEIVDFLAVVDIDVQDQFRSVAHRLYKDFYLTNKIVSLPLMKILNWRDRAPMAHWLSNASEEDRKFLTTTIARMFRIDGNETVADMFDSKIRHGGSDPDLSTRLKDTSLGNKRVKKLDHLASNPSPMDHPSLQKLNTASVVLRGAQRFGSLAERARERTKKSLKETIHEVSEETSTRQSDSNLCESRCEEIKKSSINKTNSEV